MKMPSRSARLFHSVVIVGAALTGGAVGVIACSSDEQACDDSRASCYATIGYAHIGVDSGSDNYAHIAYNPDAYAQIAIDTGSSDAADATPPDADAADAPGDGSDSG
jgi:hypothetical protein